MSLLSSTITHEGAGSNLVPQYPEAEREVLGSILADSGLMDDIGYLVPDDFHYEQNAIVWQAYLDMHNEGKPIDYLTIIQELQNRGKLHSIGGRGYIDDLTHGVVTTLNVEAYAAQVKEAATRRRLMNVSRTMLNLAGGIPITPLETALSESESMLIAVTEDHASGIDRTVTAHTGVKSLVDRLLISAANPGGMGIKCGLKSLDDELGGFEEGLFYLFAGRSGMGKSTALCQIALGIAEAGRDVLFFSLEMPPEAVFLRMAAQSARVNSDLARRGQLSKDDNEALHIQLDRISKLPIEVEASGSLSVPTMRAIARRRERRGNLGAVFIDTLNAVPGQGEEYERLTNTAIGMGAWALTASYALIGAVQINRENTRTADKRPALWNLQGSSALEQKPDVVIGIHRPYYYDQSDETQEHIAYMLMLKNRYGRSDGDVKLYYDASWPGFATLASKHVNLNDPYVAGRQDSKSEVVT